MSDSPYYHEDGRAFRLKGHKVETPDLVNAKNTSYLHPKPGNVLHLSATATIMPRAERMNHDRDMPMNLRVAHLARAAPHVPHHAVHTMVHNSPDMTVEELASILQLLSWEEIMANSQRDPAPPPKEAPPLPTLDPETREAPLQCLVSKKPPRRRKGTAGRLQGSTLAPATAAELPRTEVVWQCAECTLENPAVAGRCALCEAPKVAGVITRSKPKMSRTPASERGHWACSACTYDNEGEEAACWACGTPCVSGPECPPRLTVEAGPVWGAAKSALPQSVLTFKYEPQLILHYELQPGLVLIKSMMDIKTQQWVVDESFRLGTNPEGRTGGFFRVTESGDVQLNQLHRAQFGEQLDSFAPHFRELCLHFFRFAQPLTQNMPEMAAHWCNFNFYAPTSKGIAWHRDGDETPERLKAGTGRPVVSFSLGDSCDFRWKNHTHEDDNIIRLESGDVLLFGGPSRGILHSVTKLYPNSAPKLLRIRAGRLNLTYRHSHDED